MKTLIRLFRYFKYSFTIIAISYKSVERKPGCYYQRDYNGQETEKDINKCKQGVTVFLLVQDQERTHQK